MTAHVHDIPTGALDLAPFIDQHRPRVIVYDAIILAGREAFKARPTR